MPSPDAEDDEYSKPPPIDLETATRIATMQVATAPGSGATQPASPDMTTMPSAQPPKSPNQLTLEALLAQPNLRGVLHQMARDLGYIVTREMPGELTPKMKTELKDLGVRNELLAPVTLVASKVGAFETPEAARKAILKALKGLPEKAVKGVLETLLSLAEPTTKPGPYSDLGPELTAVQPFPIVGSMEFDVDLSPAPPVKPQPDLRLLGGHIGNRVKQRQDLAMSFAAIWPKPIKDASSPAGERRVLERWRIDVLHSNGNFEVGLPGLGGWRGFSYTIPPDQATGVVRFKAPSLPGLYLARLVDSRGVRAQLLIRVAGSG